LGNNDSFISNNDPKGNQAYKGEDSNIINASGNQSVDSHNIIGNNNKIEDYSVTNINDNRKIYTNVYEGNSFSALLDSSAKTFYFNLDNRKVKKIYDYRSNNIGLVGRDKEIEKLYDFINEDFEFITSITAQGGTGKSKLAYEFVKQSREDSRISENWDMFFVDCRNFFNKFKNITDFDPISKNYVLVFDYVLAYADEIRNFLHILVSNMSLIGKKVKVILIERTSSKSDEDYVFNSEYNWYQKIIKNRQEGEESLEDYFYEDIVLSKLEEEDYIEIVKKYVEKNYQEEVEKYNSDAIKEKILKPFTEVDPDFNRVLYLLITVDMVVGLNKEIKGKTQLLKYISEREERRINTILGELKPKIYQSIKRILSYATATDKFDLVELSGNQEHFLYKDWEKIYNACCGDWNVIINIFGQIYNEDVGDANLPTIKPDLLGELFCLDLLECEKKDINNRINKINFVKKFVCTASIERLHGLYEFFVRIIQDYAEERNIEELAYELKDFNIAFYCVILTEFITVYKSKDKIEKILTTLEDVYEKNKENENIATLYVNGLYKARRGCIFNDIVTKIENAYNDYKDNNEIVMKYAMILWEMSIKEEKKEQSPEEYKKQICIALKKLEKLHKEHNTDRGVKTCYVRTLFMLSNIQKKDERKETVKKIGEIYEEQKDINEITLLYVVSLVNLTGKGSSEEEIEEIADEIGQILKEHKGNIDIKDSYTKLLFNMAFGKNVDIVGAYATVLFNLAITQKTRTKRIATVNKLGELYFKYKEKEEVATEYANALLYILAMKDTDEEREAVIEKQGEIYLEHKDSKKIARIYSIGLFNITAIPKAEEKAIKIQEKLEEIYNKYKDNFEIVLNYTKGLYNISLDVRTEEKTKEIYKKLENIFREYKQNEEIVMWYLKGLYNLVHEQDTIEDKEETLKKIEEIYNEHYENKEIATRYVISLFNLLTLQESKKDISYTADRIEKVFNKYKEDTNIAVFYARVLYELVTKYNTLEKISEIQKKIEEIYNKHNENEEILVIYVISLSNLLVLQESIKDISYTLDRMGEVFEKHKEDVDIAVLYARALYKLAPRFNTLEMISEIVEKIGDAYLIHQDNEELEYYYSVGMRNLSYMHIRKDMELMEKIENQKEETKEEHEKTKEEIKGQKEETKEEHKETEVEGIEKEETKEEIKEEIKEETKEEIKEEIKEETKEEIKEEIKEETKEVVEEQTKDDNKDTNTKGIKKVIANLFKKIVRK